MKIGAFSISLNVKDLKTSQEFYEKLGFTIFAGNFDQNYLIMKNGDAIVGLFKGMFQNNILTFNPGWDQDCNLVEGYDDVRSIQKTLKSKGVSFQTEADENTTGPAHFVILDPDGNTILVDQHI